ncbi:MAG: ABC transporter ATP-binding protein [Chloroflexota bacterium]
MTDAAIAFDGTSKRYRNGTLALHEVSWSIPVGARACLLGPNGSGKTTSIRLLEAALAPTTGWVSLLGTPVGGRGYAEVRQRTGVVPQNAGMYADLTTAEYLELARRLYTRGDVARILETFGLAEHRDKRLAQLSGGFQRRVVIAAALLSEPDLLLLDEPTVGLDPVAAHEVHGYLAEAMRGRTTLLCTHNLAEAEALCDDVVILRRGEVLLHEPLAALRHRQKPRARLAARQGAAALAAALRARRLEPTIDGESVSVSIDAKSDGPELLRGLLASGIDVYECTPLVASLEDVFLEVVKR